MEEIETRYHGYQVFPSQGAFGNLVSTVTDEESRANAT
jgi:hypothetical protein